MRNKYLRYFIDTLSIILKEPSILSHNKDYSQVYSMAMGFLLSPTLVNIFQCHNKIIWLKNCPPPKLTSKYYQKFLDDIFVLFENLSLLLAAFHSLLHL